MARAALALLAVELALKLPLELALAFSMALAAESNADNRRLWGACWCSCSVDSRKADWFLRWRVEQCRSWRLRLLRSLSRLPQNGQGWNCRLCLLFM